MNEVFNSCLIGLNNVGRGFWDYAAGIFVQSGLLIIMLLIIDFLLRKRVRAVFRYCVWMLVFVKLVLPPSLCLPTGIGYWFGDYLSTDSPVLERPSNIVQHEPVRASAPRDFALSAEVQQIQPSHISPETASQVTSAFSSLPPLTWQAFLFLLWLVGVLVILVLLIRRMSFVKELVAQSEPAKNRLLDVLNECRRQVGIRRNIELRLSNNMSAPAVCGLFEPTILVPTALLEKLSPDKLRAVLVHELVHIKRADIWVNSVQTVLQIIYFYNPFVWLANAMVRRVREQAVDEMVLVTLKPETKNYSNTLIDIAEMAFWKTSLSLRLIGVVESKKALHRRIRHMLNRPIPKSAKIGIAGLIAIIITASILLPMAKAKDQSMDNTLTILDSDKDGLENQLEAKLGTNPKKTDTDSDGLSDYDEYCKYRTDPRKKDSDGDGKLDKDWQERREYTYTIRALCEIRPPSDLKMINDPYQDARPVKQKAFHKDGKIVEVLIFPFATAHVYPQPYPKEIIDKKLKEYIKPTVSMNYSPETKEEISDIIEGVATDVEAIEKMLRWINSETELIKELPHWSYFNIVDGKIVWHKSVGDSQQDKRFLETNFFGDSMFKKKVHGTCSSTAILRGTMFRAAGLPTRLIQTLPLITRYSEDPEPLADRLRMRAMAKGYNWGPGNGGANHTYNEVFLNNRWVRVDSSIGTGPFVGDKLFVKVWSSASWNNLKEEWNKKRCFRALDVSDAYPKYKSESTRADIAIEDKNLTVTKQPDGRFRARVSIHNYGNTATPQFKIIFYAGDPSKKRRKVYPGHHNAGPIMPRGTWNEGTFPFTLNESETEIFVIVDPDNMVDELDETNNKASAAIPGRQPKKSVETNILNKQTTQAEAKMTAKEGEKAARKASGVDITPADFDIRLYEKRGLCQIKVSIHNQSNVNIPKFKLRFYRGDPKKNLDEAGNVHSGWHEAGPIEPGKSWNELTRTFHLADGQYEFNVVLDYDNSISEIDENNNRAVLQLRIENGRMLEKSAICPSSPKDLKPDVQVEVEKEKSGKSLQQLIDSAQPGDTVTVPKGLYIEPIEINKPLTLLGESRTECVFEVTANRPAIFIDTKGKGNVTVQDLMIKWQLATSDKGVEHPFALGVKDTKAEINNCSFVPLGNFRRSPVAVRADGFSNLAINRCRFEGFEYVICYGEGTKGITKDCLIMNCGHQGIINYSGSTLHVERNVITGSKFHAVRCTGGTLYVKDNLLIKNDNRGIYLGNRSGNGTITNNLIIGNGTGIGGFARARYEIKNNIIADSSYAGIGMEKSCSLVIRDNIFMDNERGWVMFDRGERGGNTCYRNTFWQNKIDAENFKKTGNSINADPGFVDSDNGDFSLRPGPALQHKQGLINPQVFKMLWNRWKNRADKNEPFITEILRARRTDVQVEVEKPNVLRVPSDEYPTILSAIAAANTGDKIVISNHRQSRWYEEGP